MPNSLGPHGLQPTRLLCPWNFPCKDTGVGGHFFLQGIFPTQGSNLGLLYCRQILYQLSSKGSIKLYFTSNKNLHIFGVMKAYSGGGRRKWQPTPVFLPRESCGQRSLVGCCPQGHTELDMTEATAYIHALEMETATHSSILAWRIAGREEPGGLLSMGSYRVRHDWSNLAAAAA